MRNFRIQTLAAIGLTLLALFSTACESDEDPQATSTVSPTPTSSANSTPTVTSTPDYGAPDPCPVAIEICDFATGLQRLISTADVDALDALLQPSDFVCPGVELGAGGPFPLCDGARDGEVRQGFRITRLQSDGGTVERSLLPQLRSTILDEADTQLGYYDQPYVIGIHCPVVSGSPDCGEQFIVYFSMLFPSTNFVVERKPEGLRVVALQMGNTLEKPEGIAFHRGELPYVDDGVGPGWFYPWRGEYAPDPQHQVPRRWLFAPSEVTGVTVEPASGPCPATLTLTLLGARPTEPLKEPLAEVWVVSGVRGIQHTIGIPGRPPLVKLNPPWLPNGQSVEIRVDPDMLGGTLCDAETISLIAWAGAGGPFVGGYAIER